MPRTFRPVFTACLLAGVAVISGCDSTPSEPAATESQESPSVSPAPTLDFQMALLDGSQVQLSERYAGEVVLVVNVASKCGYTRQYAGLQELHERYADQGLAILGFPCNQFRNQEPGSAEEIQAFCQENYGVEFDMFAKIDVNGPTQAPLYAYLTDAARNPQAPDNGAINWNFEKFLIGRDGTVLAHFRSQAEPTGPEMIAAIEAALQGT